MDAPAAAAPRALTWLRRAFGPLALAFLVAAAVASRDVFARVVADTDPAALGAIVIAWACLHLLMPEFTRGVLAGLGHRIGYAQSLRIHLAALPARYLPGGVWHTVSRIAALRERGVPSATLAALVVLENTVPLGVALLLGGGLAVAAGDVRGGLAAAAGVAVLVSAPAALARRPFGAAPPPRAHVLLAGIAVFAVLWLAAAALFAAYWRALPEAGIAGDTPAVMATYLLSWSAGFVAVFAPQGVGVFESVASLLLHGAAGFAGIAVLVAGFRALTIAADLLAFAFFVAAGQIRRVRAQR